MGPWAALSEPELEAARARERILDGKIAAARENFDNVRRNVKPSSSLEKCVPKTMQHRLRQRLNSADLLADLKEAETDHQWAIYDRRRSKRPLYPRKRAISPGSQAFIPRKQQYDALQSQSPFFARLPPELRAEIYRLVFGGYLLVDITATTGGHNGPPPSKDYTVFFGSRTVNLSGEEFVRGQCYSSRIDAKKWRPHILPLLTSCRKVYAEAIPLLYGEMTLKSHGHHNSTGWSRYLLKPRLETIRAAHLQLTLGYPWGAPCFDNCFEALLVLPGLQKLCILGRSSGMIDCNSNMPLISDALWQEKKHLFVPQFKKFMYVREVDIFLPIRREILAKNKEDKLGHIRVHGLTEAESVGKVTVLCACRYMPEKMGVVLGQE